MSKAAVGDYVATSVPQQLCLCAYPFPHPVRLVGSTPNFNHRHELPCEPPHGPLVPRTWVLSSTDSWGDHRLEDARFLHEGQAVTRVCEVSPAGLLPRSLTTKSPMGGSRGDNSTQWWRHHSLGAQLSGSEGQRKGCRLGGWTPD